MKGPLGAFSNSEIDKKTRMAQTKRPLGNEF